jgi:UDP-glucose 4-epimerase
MENVLITGGCGFVGTNLVRQLLSEGCPRVTVIDNFFSGKRSNLQDLGDRVRVLEMDIGSADLPALFAADKFSTVIHLAAIHYIPYCDSHPLETCRVNIDGTQALIDSSVRYGVRRFFQASTAAVYKSSETPHSESADLEPIDIYGLSKLANEYQVKFCSRTADCSFVIGRISNVVGPYETNPHLVPELLKRLHASWTIEVGNTSPKRDYIHVADVCRAIMRVTFSSPRGVHICNVGTGKAYSVAEVIKALEKITGRNIAFVSTPQHSRAIDRPLLALDISKISREYGWSPQHSLEDSLRDALEYVWGGRAHGGGETNGQGSVDHGNNRARRILSG